MKWWCAIVAAAAVATPGSWLTGDIEPGDPRKLVLGAWILRGALLAIAALLAVAPRFERRSPLPPLPPREDGRGTWILAALLVAATALRAYRLDAPMWYDEIWMLLDSVRPPLASTLRTFATDNNHPLYSFLATLSVRAFGESAWALRLPALVFGVAGVAALYALARDRLGTATALAAAAVLALSAHHIGFSQNARAYTGLLCFGLVASHAFLRALETGRRRDWICHGVALALCVALHLTGVFFAFGHVAVLAWAAWRRPAWLAPGGIRAGLLGLGLATLASFAAYALVFPQLLAFFRRKPEPLPAKAEWTKPTWFLDEAALSLGVGLAAGRAALAAGVAVGVAGVVAAWRRMPALVLLAVVPGAAMAGVMLGLGRNLWPRLFFFLAGFAVLIAIEGVLEIARVVPARLLGAGERTTGRVRIAAIGLVVVACAAMVPRAFAMPKQDFGAAKDYVESVRRPGEPVVTLAMASHVYAAYYRTDWVEVRTPEELERALPAGTTGYVVYTLPGFIESRMPAVWKVLQEKGREAARIRGSIGDGDVVVLKLGP